MLSRDADAAAVRFPPPLVYAASLGLGWLLSRFVMPFDVPWLPDAWLWPLALLPGCIGLVMLAYAAGLFVRSGQNPEPWKTTPSIVQSGIYRWTRNPMYVGMALLQIAVGLALDNAWMVLLSAASLGVVYVIAVVPEERYLEQKFGEPYLQYKRSVRRWL